MPRTTEKPNRWVGGKPDRRNMPKPAQTTLMEKKIGFHSLEQAADQASHDCILPSGCRLTHMSIWIIASTPIPIATLGAGAEMMSTGTRKWPSMPSIRRGMTPRPTSIAQATRNRGMVPDAETFRGVRLLFEPAVQEMRYILAELVHVEGLVDEVDGAGGERGLFVAFQRR